MTRAHPGARHQTGGVSRGAHTLGATGVELCRVRASSDRTGPRGTEPGAARRLASTTHGSIVDDVAERVGGRREAVARSEAIGGTSVHADTLSDDGHGRTGWPASCDAVTRTRVRAMRNGERVLSGTGDVRPAGPPAAPHIACEPPRVRGLSVRPMVLW
jgi:hypothetical protein